jgi:cyclophilin family peptidyl-prolyl cis-trans isomerase
VALAEAYDAWRGDATYGPRAAALAGLVAYGPGVAATVLAEALADRDWAVRVRAAELLVALDGTAPRDRDIGPAPNAPPPGVASYDDDSLLSPPFSPQLYVETNKGTIQIELAVRDAPVTVRALMELARRGFFTGLSIHRVEPNGAVQMGDPRGDGQGGPGFTLRDEISQRPYLRGTVGMAIDWADTGGSQFFITRSPQPRRDGRNTVIGTVVEGMDVVDRLQTWDTIRRVRVWDGVSMSEE